ncbi:Uncharacterized protein OBRU01_13548, partial [Operophtera brumata]
MDVNDLLKDIKNLYDYVAVTQDVSSKRKTIKVALNISTVFSLKKIRSFEIEKIVIKDSAIPNMLVELTARGLLALATAPRPTCGFLECLVRWVVPRHEPGMRAAAADKWLPSGLCPPAARSIFVNSDWINFFRRVSVAANMVSTGYLPLQCGFLECLMRWVVPRHEPGMRAAAADKWLPSGLCPPAARSFFEEDSRFSHPVEATRQTHSATDKRANTGRNITQSSSSSTSLNE